MSVPMSLATTQSVLDQWVMAGWLRPLDRAFARFLQAESEARDQPANALLILLAACLSRQCGRGHTGLEVAALLQEADAVLSLPLEHQQADASTGLPTLPSVVLHGVTREQVEAALASPLLVAAGAGNTPLVYAEGKLSLRRYWQYEQSIAHAIQKRIAQQPVLDEASLSALLQRLFPRNPDKVSAPDWQKMACALAARSAFSVITGGPGTGKTTTVVKLLAVLQGMALATNGVPLLVSMAAPTGKAAARLNDAISVQIDSLRGHLGEDGAAVCAAITANVTTLHKLLGTIPASRHFRHNASHPLPADVVVVDEASMVDVEMMSCLLAALKPTAHLVLLGDKDQLASVEPGAVLGQLCQHAEAGRYTAATVDWVQRISGETMPVATVSANGTGLDQAVIMLRHSHRFGRESGIGTLARAVNAGDVLAVQQCLEAGSADIQHCRVNTHASAALDRVLLDGYRPCWQHIQTPPANGDHNAWALTALRWQARFQVLCAVRQGDWGVEGINRRTENVLRRERLLPPASEWYAGRPVLVTRNDYGLRLMNGDMGITLPDAEGRLRVVFADVDAPDGVRWVLPARLNDVQTVFAMTVHKSQGSEFGHAVLVLPDRTNPVLTRELLYTGITRAANTFTLIDSDPTVLPACVERRVMR